MPTVASSPNIALIKYWGNQNNDLRLPAADSLSMTIDAPTVRVTVEPSEKFLVKSEKGTERIHKHFELVKNYLQSIGKGKGLPANVEIEIHSDIPPGIGIASSAAVFSALAEAYAALLTEKISREEVSVLARLGSGSAARSIFGGFVALENGKARQIAPESHWMLHDIILVPSIEEKKVGSTEGHALANTSPLFAERLKQIPRRMRECIDAIQTKDFEKLQRVAEEDSLDMHRCMETQTPSLKYLSDETWRIIREVEALRKSDHLDVLYTMDAGPTVHLICTEEAKARVEEYAHAQKNCKVFTAKIGSGSHIA